jgi:2'-5' RNA ligase
MRLFTAIELPDDVREHLHGVQSKLRERDEFAGAVSWVKPENLHVTLKFLGAVAQDDLGKINEALSRVAVEKMTLQASEMMFFPRRGTVRVIGALVGGDSEKIAMLYDRIEDACGTLGFEREGRAYTPHVTFGRVRRERCVKRFDDAREFPGPTFTANHFALIRSQPKPTGPIYTVVKKFSAK